MFILQSKEFIIKKRVKLKNLNLILKKKAGRNNKGQIIHYGRGGGYKRMYRIVDFTRFVYLLPFYIIRFEYDPNRNSFLMLISYINGFLSYKLAANLTRIGFYMLNGRILNTKYSCVMQIVECLTGSLIYNYQLKYLELSKYVRTAGNYIQIVRKLGSYTLLRLPSGEERFVSLFSYCCLGRIAHDLVKLLKKKKLVIIEI